jgi:uncharacterized protein
MELHRRQVLVAAAAAGAIGVAGAVAAPPIKLDLKSLKKEADVACLYHCDFGDPARFAQMLTNLSNHFSVYGNPLDIQLAIVVHGQGLKFFLETLEDTPWKDEKLPGDTVQRLSDLANSGLKVYLCEITFARLKIDPGKARQAGYIRFVPSGVAAVGALQAQGFGYLKTG